METASGAQRLRWLQSAARAAARPHPSVEADELVSEAVLSLEGDLSRVTSYRVAYTVVSRRLVDYQRRVLGRGSALRPQRDSAYDVEGAAFKEEAPGADEGVDLSVLSAEDQYIVRRRLEGATHVEIGTELGWKVTKRGSAMDCSKVGRRYQRALRRLEGARVAARRKEARRR